MTYLDCWEVPSSYFSKRTSIISQEIQDFFHCLQAFAWIVHCKPITGFTASLFTIYKTSCIIQSKLNPLRQTSPAWSFRSLKLQTFSTVRCMLANQREGVFDQVHGIKLFELLKNSRYLHHITVVQYSCVNTNILINSGRKITKEVSTSRQFRQRCSLITHYFIYTI